MADYFVEHGFDIASFTCLGFDDDREMARIAPSALVAADIEKAIGKPVVTSNQASAWNCLRLCGDDTAHPEWGRLMTLQLGPA
jgi:maleate isomerase